MNKFLLFAELYALHLESPSQQYVHLDGALLQTSSLWSFSNSLHSSYLIQP